jgi:hypothetical protein
MTPQDALGFLRGPTTERFLAEYLVTINGKPGPPSAVIPYYIWPEPRGGKDGFKVAFSQNLAGPGHVQFPAHSIYMVEGNTPYNVVALDGYVLDGNGPDIMVTGMLNGCSFLMKANADKTQVRCAHLRPAAGANGGEMLNVRMVNNAQFHGDAGALAVYGRNNYPNTLSGRSSTVIGVRKGGVWGIYQQQFDGNWKVLVASQIL